ncbi:MAG: chemotaxis protein CheC [Leptolyngbyaceae bacterium]|nr:chemotaxis protein CheC [Leptolyngbyaceae bacterium]
MSPTADQLDALQELINIGVGRAAAILNEMLDLHVYLQVPLIKMIPLAETSYELEQRLGKIPVSSSCMNFSGSFTGTAQLVFPRDSAAKLVCAFIGEETEVPDLDAVKVGTLNEVGNIVINSEMGSISNLLKQHLNYSIPLYLEDTVEHLLAFNKVEENATVLLAQARFTIQQLLITGDIILIFTVKSFETLLETVESGLG